MSFLKRIFGRGCPHRFTWPRFDNNGRHYQICLTCGTAYEYDWNGMHPTNRLLVVNAKGGSFPEPLHHGQVPAKEV